MLVFSLMFIPSFSKIWIHIMKLFYANWRFFLIAGLCFFKKILSTARSPVFRTVRKQPKQLMCRRLVIKSQELAIWQKYPFKIQKVHKNVWTGCKNKPMGICSIVRMTEVVCVSLTDLKLPACLPSQTALEIYKKSIWNQSRHIDFFPLRSTQLASESQQLRGFLR